MGVPQSHRRPEQFSCRLCKMGPVLRRSIGLLSAGLVSAGWVLTGGTAAFAQRTTVFDLDQAICANDWDRAISAAGMLIADENTRSVDRNALLALRRQLAQYRAENVLVDAGQACDRSNPYLLAEVVGSEVAAPTPLGWQGAIAEVTDNRYTTEVITASTPFSLPVHLGNQPGLSPAEPVDLSQGLTVVPGHVGPGHQVYGFVAGMGDRLALAVEVTRVMTGTLYTSDDSQLFVFDREGRLIASADDNDGGQQSRISDLVIPKTDLYFAVVTSYNNDPIFNQDGRLTGWQENGGGRFDYTLSVSGATPTSALVR
ncbi:MAG: hypothetical protein AAFO83_02950 [Cyanobacteria bacterium J06607_13]